MIFKRLRNLWRLSAIEVPKTKTQSELLKIVKDIITPHAKIVDLIDPLEDLKL